MCTCVQDSMMPLLDIDTEQLKFPLPFAPLSGVLFVIARLVIMIHNTIIAKGKVGIHLALYL